MEKKNKKYYRDLFFSYGFEVEALDAEEENLRLLFYNHEDSDFPVDHLIETISDIPSLERIDIENVKNSCFLDFSPFSKLTKLRSLRIYCDTNIKDLTFLNKDLKEIHLESSKINSLDILKSFENLETISLPNASLHGRIDLSPWKKLKYLNLSNNKIDEVCIRKSENNETNVTSIRSLNLSNNMINEVDFLNDLPLLDDLDLAGNKIKNLDGWILINKQLRCLNIEGNQINSISFLKDLHLIESLNIGHTNIQSISIIEQFKESLISLSCHGNKIKNFDVLSKLNKLEKLDVSDNHILNQSINLPYTVKEVNLSSNLLKNLDHINLKKSIEIEILNLSHNQLYQINSLYHLHNIRELNLSYNKIERYFPIHQYKHLQTIHLLRNSIDDFIYLIGYLFNENYKPKTRILDELWEKIGFHFLENNHFDLASFYANKKKKDKLKTAIYIEKLKTIPESQLTLVRFCILKIISNYSYYPKSENETQFTELNQIKDKNVKRKVKLIENESWYKNGMNTDNITWLADLSVIFDFIKLDESEIPELLKEDYYVHKTLPTKLENYESVNYFNISIHYLKKLKSSGSLRYPEVMDRLNKKTTSIHLTDKYLDKIKDVSEIKPKKLSEILEVMKKELLLISFGNKGQSQYSEHKKMREIESSISNPPLLILLLVILAYLYFMTR